MKKFLDWQRINIFQIASNEIFVDYHFCCDLYRPDEAEQGKYRIHQTNFGQLRIYRENGQVEIVQNMPDDKGGRRAAAAIYKLQLHWQRGEFPQRTQYASG